MFTNPKHESAPIGWKGAGAHKKEGKTSFMKPGSWGLKRGRLYCHDTVEQMCDRIAVGILGACGRDKT